MLYGISNVPSVQVLSVAGPDIVLAAITCRAPVAISVEEIYTTSGETPVVTPSKIEGVLWVIPLMRMRKPLLKSSKLLSLTSASGDDRAALSDDAPATSSDGAPDTSEDADAPMTPYHDDQVMSGDDATSIARDADPATPGKKSSVAPGFRTW